MKKRLQRQKRLLSKTTALLIASAIGFGCVLPAAAGVYADSLTVSISSPEDWADFADRCKNDGYADGKTVLLTADIDLSGLNSQKAAAVFGGVFDGQGHTIKGILIQTHQDDSGLFRFIEEEGVVKNLNVDIQFTNDTGANSGGIAGTNKGLIENCTVLGSVDGTENVGGIVGLNLGTILNSVNKAAVSGDKKAGGIAGVNSGIIQSCSNGGLINPDPNDTATDLGGIAGSSTGSLIDCLNTGDVGYQSTGYNVGGIAGRQSGYISECRNYGSIQGRKDVGGIAGQFEPSVSVTFGEDVIQQIKQQIEKMMGIVEELKDKIGPAADKLIESLTKIDGEIDKLNEGIIDPLIEDYPVARDQLMTVLDSIDTQVNKVGGELSDALDTALEDIAELKDKVNSTIDDVTEEVKLLKKQLLERLDSLLWDVYEIRDEVRSLLSRAGEVMGSIEDAIGKMEEAQLVEKIISAVTDIADILDRLQNLMVRIDEVFNELQNIWETIEAVIQWIKDQLPGIPGWPDGGNAVPSLPEVPAGEESSPGQEPPIPEPEGGSGGESSGGETNSSGQEDSSPEQNGGDISTEEAPSGDTPAPSEEPPSVEGTSFSFDEPLEVVPMAATFEGIDLGQLDAFLTMERAKNKRNENILPDETEVRENDGKCLIEYSFNEGEVSAALNVGGIVGNMAFEMSADPEADVEFDGDFSLNPTVGVNAAVRACYSTGTVEASSYYAGGIAGQQKRGVIKDSFTSGEISAKEGYAGGIAGLSSTEITRCFSLCDLEAENFAGGIAGSGADISLCYTMARVDSEGESIGAIAGVADGELSQNYFIEEELCGVDGINYEGKAAPLPPEDFASKGSLPAKMEGFSSDSFYAADHLSLPQLTAVVFNDAQWVGETLKLKSEELSRFVFTVTFQNGDETVKTIEVPYGGSVAEEEIPPVPQKDGQTGQWEDFDRENIRRSTVVKAVYENAGATIASAGDPPLLLVEGSFGPDASVEITEALPDEEAPEGYEIKAGYVFSVDGGGENYHVSRVRVRLPEDVKNPQAGLVQNGEITAVESNVDGSYLVFDTNIEGQFVILEGKGGLLPWILGAIGLVMLIGAGAAAAAVIWKRKKGGKASSCEEETADSGLQNEKLPDTGEESRPDSSADEAENGETEQVEKGFEATE